MVAALKDFETFRCHRLHATISIDTCLARQRKARDAYKSYSNTYIGEAAYSCMLSCLDCEQGSGIAKINPPISEQEKPKLKIVPKRQKRKLPIHQIDWDDLRVGWNMRNGKKWTSTKQWLGYLYRRKPNIHAMAKMLGVSDSALSKRLRDDGIIETKRGPSGKQIFVSIPEERMATMTKLEIARETGLSVGTVESLIYRHGRRYQMAGSWRNKGAGK